jgi:hypothetical protein
MPLVRTNLVEVAAVLDEDLVQVLFAEHQRVVQTFSPDAAQEAFAHAVRAGRSNGRLEHSRADALGGAVEVRTELIIPIANDEARPDAEGRRVTHLLRYPRAIRLAGDADVDHFAQLGGRRPLLVPVRAVETTGIDLIPDAMSHEMALRLGLDVTLAIVQTNTVGHTRAGGFHRLAFQPTFDGQVEAGRDHVLVDDHVGLG